ncbi:hypothetical protein CC1G_14917 [Coprinopsis cinerea okayama7|uniref:Uncharacterized protein n=1 Tax=Coprinopsis cinerea (strain Okayama-7 / 130 / ATCC MYA-4618 / FGSC 9003) TaxID=240176 RepID=D6RNY2_COPC7|nr:hypothetical protein CC1G_14917 [Coprinopsis cinerea okayama7\|eukprot:XP_002910939.1 hypothetical protein CC1G_14917 [Coprinopsis cinerea okayama7\
MKIISLIVVLTCSLTALAIPYPNNGLGENAPCKSTSARKVYIVADGSLII